MTTAGTQRGRGVDVTPAWSGSLEETPLAELVRRIVLEERSGELRVAAPPLVKTISFDRGFIVYAESNLESEGLGNLLVESGRISKHELALVGMLTRAGKKSLRQSLVQGGIVSEEELGRFVAVQVNDIVLSLFSVARGTYRFEEGPCATPIDLMVSLSAHRILLEGIRRMSSGKLILAGLPAFKNKLRLVDEPPFTLDVEKLRPVEKAVLRLTHRGLSIGRIVNTIGEDKGKALRACYSLYAAGVLEPVTTEALRPRPIQEETGSFLVSEILRKVRPAEQSSSATPAVTDVPSVQIPAAPIPTSIDDEPATEDSAPNELPTLATLEEQGRDSRGEEEQRESSGGLIGTLGALWSSLVGWFAQLLGAFTKSTHTDEESTTDEREQADVGLSSSEIEAGETGLEPASTVSESSEMPPTVEAIGVPSWSMMDEPGPEESANPAASMEEPADQGVGIPSWSMRDTPSENLADDASSRFVEESDYHEPVVERLGVPKWSLKDAPEETVPKPRKKPITRAPEPRTTPMTLSIEDEDPMTPASRYQPSLVDSSPILEDDLVELEPEENPEHSMLDAIPLEELSHEEESPELLIMVDEDAFADVPEFGQDVAPLPHEERSRQLVRMEEEEADEVTVVVESDVPSFEPPFEPEPVSEPEPDLEPEPEFSSQVVLTESSEPSVSIDDDDDDDVEFDVEPDVAEAPVSRLKRSRVVARPKEPSKPTRSKKIDSRARVTAPPSKTRRVAKETPPPSRKKATVVTRTKKAVPQAPNAKVPPVPVSAPRKKAPPAQASAPASDRKTRPAPVKKAPPAQERKTPPAAGRATQPEPMPQRSPVPIQPTAEHNAEVSASQAPAESIHGSNEDVVGAEVRLLRDVKLHFKVRDWAGAVPLLERLVRLSPGNALYRGMLGRAMTARPELRNNAEKHFVEALRLSPQDPELHYWLGLYYKSFGLESRAFNEFRTTLRINPQHAGAKKQLGAAGKRGTGGGMLKKLFG